MVDVRERAFRKQQRRRFGKRRNRLAAKSLGVPRSGIELAQLLECEIRRAPHDAGRAVFPPEEAGTPDKARIEISNSTAKQRINETASDQPELRYFAEYIAAGFERVEPVERFFMDAERPASRVAERRLGRNLAAYARWGFVGSERPIADPVSKRALGRYDARTRRSILHELVARRGELSLADYLDAVDHAISRQQALADLRGSPQLQLEGHGRGAKWRSRAVTPTP